MACCAVIGIDAAFAVRNRSAIAERPNASRARDAHIGPVSTAPRFVSGSAILAMVGDGLTPALQMIVSRLDAPPALQRQPSFVGACDAVAENHFDAAPFEHATRVAPIFGGKPGQQ